MQYRRIIAPGGTFFFTLVTYNRRIIFVDEDSINLLRNAIQYVMLRHPFKIDAAVIIPDHLHMLWRLPEGDSNYSTRLRLLKSHFTHHWCDAGVVINTDSRLVKGEQAVWQRHFWEHLIRDDADWKRHVDYIHYNPVKHGLVRSPAEWKFSSFHNFVRNGLYPVDWGAGEIRLDMESGAE